MLALSSTAGVLRVLMDRAEIDSPHGRNAVAIPLVQDIAVARDRPDRAIRDHLVPRVP